MEDEPNNTDIQKQLDTLKAELEQAKTEAANLSKEVEGKTIAQQRALKERNDARQQLEQVQPAFQELQQRWNTWNQRLNDDPYGVIQDIQTEVQKVGIQPPKGQAPMVNPNQGFQAPDDEEPQSVKQIREQNATLAKMVKDQQQALQNLYQQQQQLSGSLGRIQQSTVRERFNAVLDQKFAGKSFRFKTPQAKQVIYDNLWNRAIQKQINPVTQEPFSIDDGVDDVANNFLSAPDEEAEAKARQEAERRDAAQRNAGYSGSPPTGDDMGGEIPEDWEPETDEDIEKMYDKISQNIAAMEGGAQQPQGEV